MGAKSTIDMERNEAIDLIQRWLHAADNETVGRVLEELNDDAGRRGDYEHYVGLNNFRIV